jgi:hypothetical protein
MGAMKLIEEARSAGLKLRAEGDRLVIRGPKSAEPLAKALLDRKAEILPFLQERPAPRPFHDDARDLDSEAALWLRQKLATGPMRIGDLMRLWCEPVVGRASGDISARIDQLTDARTSLDVEAFAGDDGKFWWRLPVVPAPDAWLCPHCGQPATIEDVFPSEDGERTLTIRSCEPCQIVSVTPDAIKEPPTGWVPKTRQ